MPDEITTGLYSGGLVSCIDARKGGGGKKWAAKGRPKGDEEREGGELERRVSSREERFEGGEGRI